MAQCLINNTGNKGANGVMIQILNFFVGKGYTPTQACAIAGNVFGESSYIPTKKNELGCIGLFQWCFSRKDKVIAKYGDPGWKDINNQLNYVWSELQPGGERASVGTYFSGNKDKTLKEYTYHWLRYFETPSTNENELRNKFMPTRFEYANKAAALYNQMNKGECTVNSDSSDDDSGFSCDMSEEAVSDVNFVDTSVSTTADTQGTDSSGGTSNNKVDLSTRPLFITDEAGMMIVKDIKDRGEIWWYRSNGTYKLILERLKTGFSDKNFRPKFIVIFLCGPGLKWGKSYNERWRECESFVNSIQDHTGYTNVYWISSISTVNNIVNPKNDKDKAHTGWILNANALLRGDSVAYKDHFKYDALGTVQEYILDSSRGYRNYKNKTYMLNSKGVDFIRRAIEQNMRSYKTGRIDV